MRTCRDNTRLAYLSAILLSAVHAASACTIVTPIEAFVPTRFQTYLQLMRNNKPLAGATVEIYIGQPGPTNDLAYETLITGPEGRATTSSLSVATYSVPVRPSDDRHAAFTLEVPIQKEVRVKDHRIDLFMKPVDPPQFGDSTANALPGDQVKPLEARLRQFRGTVTDPSRAVIPNVQIEVYAASPEVGSPAMRLTSDLAGGFAASLEPGQYVVFFLSRGFVEQKVVVSIDPRGWQGMLLQLALGGDCGFPAPGRESTVAELN